MKKIIIIVGLPGSGKSTAAEFIKKKFKADIVHTGDIIREEVKRRGLKYTPKTDALIAHWFHTGGREKVIVKRTWDKIKKSKKKLIVIEGFRSLKQVNQLKRLYKRRPVVIAIIASFKVRAKRELKRKRFGKQESLDYLMFREQSEKSHGLDKIIRKADYKINNSRLTVKQTQGKIINLMKKIIK